MYVCVYIHIYLECLICVRLGIYWIFEFAQPSLEVDGTHFTDGTTQPISGEGNVPTPGFCLQNPLHPRRLRW